MGSFSFRGFLSGLADLGRGKRSIDPQQSPFGIGFYDGAQINRFQTFWVQLRSADQEIKSDLARLRAHSRDLSKNNVFMRRFLDVSVSNTIGSAGITLQSAIKKGSNQGPLKENWNNEIEDAWKRWCKRGVCTVDGRESWRDVQASYVQTVDRDGEALLRKVLGADNEFGFALEWIDPDRLDHLFNLPPDSNGVQVKMGVELNRWMKPIGYWIWQGHPTDPYGRRSRIRVDAKEIIHGYALDRVLQSRGIPRCTPVTFMLSMIGSYFEAEVSAARAGSESLGFIISKGGEFEAAGGDPRTVSIQSEMATYQGLPPGMEIQKNDPQHPTTAFPPFVKTMLQSTASGLGVSYHEFTGDLSNTSYSSIRAGMLIDRRMWRAKQQWVIESLCDPVFAAWLEMAVLMGAVNLPTADMSKICKPEWNPMGFDWVDPLKDLQADLMAVNGALDTRTHLLAERGMNFEDVIRGLAEEQKAIQAAGLVLVVGKPEVPKTSDTVEGEDATETKDPAEEPDPAAAKKGAKNAA